MDCGTCYGYTGPCQSYGIDEECIMHAKKYPIPERVPCGLGYVEGPRCGLEEWELSHGR
jgi:hypothetical protein